MRILYRNEEGFLATVNVYYAAYSEDDGEKGLYILTEDDDELEFWGIDRSICESLILELYREGKVDLSVYRVTG
ncbi:MAG: hypothetical protein J6K53_04095 [Roseburia sp.]|nr:hypothetical protein [Roseburia sp.]